MKTEEQEQEDLVAALEGLDKGDPEDAHYEADRILLQALRGAGATGVADAFERARDRISFWYA